MSTIPIIVADDEETKPQSGILGGDTSPNKGVHLKHLKTEALRHSLNTLSTQIAEVLQDMQTEFGEFKLSEVHLQVEVNAEGGFALIGTAKAGTSRAITLTFTNHSK